MNLFYKTIMNRIREKYVMVVGSKYLINQLEYSLYPPETAENKNLDLLVYFNYFEGFITLMFFYLAKKSKKLTDWFKNKGILYEDNPTESPILVELHDEEPTKSYVLKTSGEELEEDLKTLLTYLENVVPTTDLELKILDNGTMAFTKPGQMDEFLSIWKYSNE